MGVHVTDHIPSGRFYTLLVISTALFDVAPFKNLICNGLVLASDGKKMSKRLKNYPDPNHIMKTYGADALRLYMINSPVVRAETLRFKEDGVRDMIKDVFLPWYNAYRFFVQNVHRLKEKFGVTFSQDLRTLNTSENMMDRWILAATHSLIKYVDQEMAAYRLYTVVPRLLKFIDDLTNWYVRLNRKRMRGEEGVEDCQASLSTLFEVLFTLTKLMAPFTPFVTENMYQNLRKGLSHPDIDGNDKSVHYLLNTKLKPEYFNDTIETRVARMQAVVELGRVIRERKSLPVKYPLQELVVIHTDQAFLDDVKAMEPYIVGELNVKTVTLSVDEHKYGLSLKAKPNSQVLGKRLGKAFKDVMAAVQKLGEEDLRKYLKEGSLDVCGNALSGEDLLLSRVFEGAGADAKYESNADSEVVVLLDTTFNEGMRLEGLAREIINRIQKLRKKAQLVPTEAVYVTYKVTKSTDKENLDQVATEYKGFIEAAVGQPFVSAASQAAAPIMAEDYEVGDGMIELSVVRREA